MSFENFDTLIHPITTDTFFSEYWEQRPLIVERKNPKYYSNLFSMQDVDNVICFTEPKFPGIQLFSHGKSVPLTSVQEHSSSHNIHEIYSEYNKGTTVILRGLQNRWKPLSDFYRSLESFFSHRVHINMYMTPKNSQGFAAHFDTHEVFILQIEGSKHWRIYDTFQELTLPINQQPLPQDKLKQPLHDIVLNAGDVLYIPSGYVHEALTSQHSSLHLTIGINVYRWIDLLSTAISSLSDEKVFFRKSLPIGFLKNGKDTEFWQQHFKELLEIFLDNANMEDAVAHLSKRIIDEMPPRPDGHFTQIDNIDSIDIDTVLKKRKGSICRLFEENDSVGIQFPGNTVKGPKYIEPALHFIANSEEFAVRSLPVSLTDDSKLLLVRRLLKEGLLMRSV